MRFHWFLLSLLDIGLNKFIRWALKTIIFLVSSKRSPFLTNLLWGTPMARGPGANLKILRNPSSEKSMKRTLMKNTHQDSIKIVSLIKSKKNLFCKGTFLKRSFNPFLWLTSLIKNRLAVLLNLIKIHLSPKILKINSTLQWMIEITNFWLD